ncbi:hypothetical protein [Deinococcus sp. Leaf326]|uniref:hypothetical protein n=1 Tax=Deinococcus sp. Leaf326 TaxID=1736338 RepID=UPI0006FE0DB8|nr:hypothetical protein [Deinococcus sp. Leaf326]KQR40891.1 hypothetical protein ASF71_01700 [Deinococcus sp. Leaf326]
MTSHPARGPQPSASTAPSWRPALLSGLAGALAVNLLNEGVRQVLPHAPRVEVIGKRALSGVVSAAGARPPRGAALYRWTLGADLLSNSLYFGLVGLGAASGAMTRGAALGLLAGVGAVTLPEPMGLGRQPGERRPLTPLLTAAWYLAGGLVAAAVYRRLSPPAPVAPADAPDEGAGEGRGEEGPTAPPI